MRTNLKVPFAEKDEAKKLGARWDPARKLWYVENKDDMSPFERWMSGGSKVDGVVAPSKKSPVEKTHSPGITVIGSKYVAQAKVCDCLPWDDCDACRAFALSH